jgi:thiosulfate/3-mercaptopyruvate sulfurtransferase
MNSYVHPEMLVSTDWVFQNLEKPGIKLVEVNVDTQAYEAGHIPGAVGFNWQTQLQDQVTRDILNPSAFEALLGGAGISSQDQVVLYGDNNNWFAAYALWLFKIYGHDRVCLMDGGRVKWLNEADRPLTSQVAPATPVRYVAKPPDASIRARVQDVLKGVRQNLVDVRSPDEFTGRVLAPPGLSETAQRAGHIPGARSVPWSSAVRADGTFKDMDELRRIYFVDAGLEPSLPTIAYCRIGERSSHTWFVLTYLLGLEQVRNYDGSWTEYGSMVGLPIELGAGKRVPAASR